MKPINSTIQNISDAEKKEYGNHVLIQNNDAVIFEGLFNDIEFLFLNKFLEQLAKAKVKAPVMPFPQKKPLAS